MKKIKKVLAVVLTLSMVATLLTACSGQSKTNQNNKTEGVTDAKKVTWETAPKVKVGVRNHGEEAFPKTGDDPQDNAYLRYIFEKTGVRIDPVVMPYETNAYKQKLGLEIASGTEIELITFFGWQMSWITNGTIVPIDDFLKKYKDKMPNVTQNIPQSAWDDTKIGDDTYFIPGSSEYGNPILSYVFLRQDWLDKLKLEMPKSTDDLTKIFKAFTENDPDGNGKKDTFGLGTRKGDISASQWIQLWGVTTLHNEIINGNSFAPMIFNSKARAGFATIGSWVKNGYVDVEGFADDKSATNKTRNDKIGGYIRDQVPIVQDDIILRQTVNKNAKFAMVPNEIKSSYDNKFYGMSATKNYEKCIMLTGMAKNFDSISKLMNWMFSEEGSEFQRYGLLGKEYNVVNGKKVMDNDYINVQKKSYLKTYAFGSSYKHLDLDLTLEKMGNSDLAKQVLKANTADFEKYNKVLRQYPDMTPNAELQAKYIDKRKGVDAWAMKFYIGEANPLDDATWSKYIKESNEYGLQILADDEAKRYFKK